MNSALWPLSQQHRAWPSAPMSSRTRRRQPAKPAAFQSNFILACYGCELLSIFGDCQKQMRLSGAGDRLKASFLGSGVITILIGVGWGIAFLHLQRPVLASMHGFLTAFGIAMVWLAHRSQLTAAAVLAAHVLPLFIAASCLFDEVPAGVHRATQMHFLPVALGAYFVFRRSRFYLKYVIPALCLIAFSVLSNTSIGFHDPALVIPARHAELGVWVNTITAIAELAFIVVVMNSDLSVRRMMGSEMRKAIANDGFTLYYQPQVDRDGTVVGAEALIRWPHATMGFIPPCDFLPIAEETGLIVPIGNWVLRASCAQLAAWNRKPETRHLTLAVNVSASQFRQPDFVQTFSEIIRLSGVDPSTLKLEITETMFVDNVDSTVSKMKALSAIGVRWSIDDFGTGYSSLSMLSQFPISQIKVDQSFVRTMLNSASSMVVTEAIIALARKLGLQVVAEGVETIEQRDRLCEAGCQVYQGYLFSAPVGIEAFDSFLPPAHACPVTPTRHPPRISPSEVAIRE